jgi:hypothetical protein
MPGTTPQGFPYADPTDPLVQWPATSQSLAEKVDSGTVKSGDNLMTIRWAGTGIYPVLKVDVDGLTNTCGIVTDGGTKPIVLKWDEASGKLQLWLDGVHAGNLVRE